MKQLVTEKMGISAIYYSKARRARNHIADLCPDRSNHPEVPAKPHLVREVWTPFQMEPGNRRTPYGPKVLSTKTASLKEMIRATCKASG